MVDQAGRDVSANGYTMPPALRQLVDAHPVQQSPVRFRPATWERALSTTPVGDEATALLRDDRFTRSIPENGRHTDDRAVDRAAVRRACTEMNLDAESDVIAAFVLVMAWGSGTTGNRGPRFTAQALADPDRAHDVLRNSASTLRGATSTHDGALERNWSPRLLPGIGPSFASKWWHFAGYRDGRRWQPLILDQCVCATLNHTFGITTHALAGSRRRAARYRGYVDAVHAWAEQLRRDGHDIDAADLEYVLFRQNGEPAFSSPDGTPRDRR